MCSFKKAVVFVFFFCVRLHNCYVHYNDSIWLHYEKKSAKPFATGTFGKLYLAHLIGSDLPIYAAKVVDPKVGRLFPKDLTEIAVQNHVKSPFVPQIYSSFFDKTIPQWAFVMDYAGPYTLDKLKKVIGQQTYLHNNHELTIFIAANILSALNDIHTANIYHRDLMLYNTAVDEEGYINIIDFGKAAIHPAAAFLAMDVEKVCQFVYRFLAVPPNSHEFPHIVDIKRYIKNMQRRNTENNIIGITGFLKACIDYQDVHILMRHSLFNGFDWDSLHSRKLASPLKPIVMNALQDEPNL